MNFNSLSTKRQKNRRDNQQRRHRSHDANSERGLFGLREWNSPFDLAKELKHWLEPYNDSYLHSALGYKPPTLFEIEFQNSHISQLQTSRVMGSITLKAKRTSSKSKPVPTAPNQWWGIDMTKVLVQSFGWIYVVIVLDWYTKKVVGYYAGLQSKSIHWLAALNMAVNRQFPEGARGHEIHLMSDNGCQPTSRLFMETCATLDIQQAFTSYNNPKGNADTERMMRILKEELFWLREWDSPFDLANELERWVERYNDTYLHSALGYKPPRQFEIEFQNSHISQFQTA